MRAQHALFMSLIRLFSEKSISKWHHGHVRMHLAPQQPPRGVRVDCVPLTPNRYGCHHHGLLPRKFDGAM
jgi:hypothetical protein